MRLKITPWMRDELDRRKALFRDLFAGRPLERLPVDVRVTVPSPVPATVQEQFRDGDKQLAAALLIGNWFSPVRTHATPRWCLYGEKIPGKA